MVEFSSAFGHHVVVNVLIVEDDDAISATLGDGLESAGHDTYVASTGRAAIEAHASRRFDVILLDLGLPDLDGRDVFRELRSIRDIPVIMVTARSEEFDRVLGLELGADDYITKPFSLRELLARLRAVTRRISMDTSTSTQSTVEDVDNPTITVGPLYIDRRTHRVLLSGSELTVTPKEFDLLVFLAEDPGAVRTRTDIVESVWDAHWYGPTKTVDAHVASLRKKLGDHRWIVSVRGVGFRLEVPS
jgi:DNA-binding response OmpR family regulator